MVEKRITQLHDIETAKQYVESVKQEVQEQNNDTMDVTIDAIEKVIFRLNELKRDIIELEDIIDKKITDSLLLLNNYKK